MKKVTFLRFGVPWRKQFELSKPQIAYTRKRCEGTSYQAVFPPVIDLRVYARSGA